MTQQRTFTIDCPRGHVTRDGRKATIVAKDAGGSRPLIAVVEYSEGSKAALTFTNNGEFFRGGVSDTDLFDVPAPFDGTAEFKNDGDCGSDYSVLELSRSHLGLCVYQKVNGSSRRSTILNDESVIALRDYLNKFIDTYIEHD